MPPVAMPLLHVIQQEVRQRAEAITSSNPNWPCHKGCHDCCRSTRLRPARPSSRMVLDRSGVGRPPVIPRHWRGTASAQGSQAVTPFSVPNVRIAYASKWIPEGCGVYRNNRQGRIDGAPLDQAFAPPASRRLR
jgi:hypothetical protein